MPKNKKMSRHCSNENFRKHRDEFDLCIVFKGVDQDMLDHVGGLNPVYLLIRENKGFDESAFDHAIKTPLFGLL